MVYVCTYLYICIYGYTYICIYNKATGYSYMTIQRVKYLKTNAACLYQLSEKQHYIRFQIWGMGVVVIESLFPTQLKN